MNATVRARPEAFFDTNVLLYLLSSDASKADRAEALLSQGGVVSVQVLNEFAAVASRKFAMPWSEIQDVLGTVRALCDVTPLTESHHDAAIALVQRHSLSFYDALIVAAALSSGCKVLWSEDMQDGKRLAGQLTLRNPFSGKAAAR